MNAASRMTGAQSVGRATFRRFTLLDTAVASTNLGDRIIMEAVRRELAPLFRNDLVLTVASHEWMGAKSRGLLAGSQAAVAGGTNLLTSRMWARAPWKVSLLDALGQARGAVVLMGCGWYQFQKRPDPYSAWLLRRMLSSSHLHAVRDGYSLRKLQEIGIRNVVNTACPTLWSLDDRACAKVPREKAPHVITTVNTYMPDPEADRRLLELLRRHYDQVDLWVQTEGDAAYARGLDPAIGLIAPSLEAYDRALSESGPVDYIGNRLHAGIRALQHGRRAVIVEIDNRAREMGRDFGLPTVERTDFGQLEARICGAFETRVTPPMDEIARWKAQFGTPDAE